MKLENLSLDELWEIRRAYETLKNYDLMTQEELYALDEVNAEITMLSSNNANGKRTS